MLLAPGFSGRVIARSGREIAGYGWHSAPGSGACFPDGGGWIYVSNSEVPLVGGVGAIRFDATGAVVVAYATLTGTSANRAGGSTPWHTWLSGEQASRGQVWETDPWGDDLAIAHPAMGVFKHQACAVDGDQQVVYLTEDQPTAASTGSRRPAGRRWRPEASRSSPAADGRRCRTRWAPTRRPGTRTGTRDRSPAA